MLLTNQPLSAITNEAYREKMAKFDPSFIVPGEQKIKTMIGKSYNYHISGFVHFALKGVTEMIFTIFITQNWFVIPKNHLIDDHLTK